MAYESVQDHEYLDLSNRKMGLKGIYRIMREVSEDVVIQQLDLSYNVSPEEVMDGKNIYALFRKIKKCFSVNKTLTALDFAGNHLFDHHAHPSNEHVHNYQKELCDVLLCTNIDHIDLSDNKIAGNSARELTGLSYFMKNYMIRGKAFRCRLSGLTSQGFQTMSHCLGTFSSLTYLDLSDNVGGLDPMRNPSSEGIVALSSALSCSLHLRVLKIARNHLRDEDLILVSRALHNMAQFQDLDASGNFFGFHGMKDLRDAVLSHSALTDPGQGFRHLDISTNPLGRGLREILKAVERSETLRSLDVSHCQIKDLDYTPDHSTAATIVLDKYAKIASASLRNDKFASEVECLQYALAQNKTILELKVDGNPLSDCRKSHLLAEVYANNILLMIMDDPQSVDATELDDEVYAAVARKLRFLDKEYLMALHDNLSFNEPQSDMQESLHLLQAPPRRELISQVLAVDAGMKARIQAAKEKDLRLKAARIIFHFMMTWFSTFRTQRNIRKTLMEAKRREMLSNMHNEEDDHY